MPFLDLVQNGSQKILSRYVCIDAEMKFYLSTLYAQKITKDREKRGTEKVLHCKNIG